MRRCVGPAFDDRALDSNSSAERAVAVGTGEQAHSIALVAFGMDSFIETASGAIVGARLIKIPENLETT
jgi:hypothetical protein